MFLWCFPDCDANLVANLNFIATSIALSYKLEGRFGFALGDTEYNSLSRKLTEELHKCYAQVNKFRNHLISSSLKAEPFTHHETIGFLDSLHVNLNDLPITVETLQETIFLLRNLVYYTPMAGESETNLIFQLYVHDWANKVACFFLLCWLIEREDQENSQETRALHNDLQQKVNPCNPEFIKLCFQVIQILKMKHVERLLFGEFVSRLVDFFLENLMLILNDHVRMVREGLIFLITFLADPPPNIVNHSELSSVREQIYAVFDQASYIICFFCDTNMDLARGKTVLDDFQVSINEVRGKIENIYVHVPHSSWTSSFPRIDRLGYFECLLAYLENLKLTMNENKKLVPFLKHHIFAIEEELLPLRLFLQDTSRLQNEHNGLKDIWEQITSLLYQADFAIKLSFFIDNAIWYNLTCLSFVIRKIKDIRYKVSNIEFETRTEGSYICRTESILPLKSCVDVPKPSTSTSIVEVVVGFKKEMKLLIDRLEWGSPHLDIISIVGMGGIGKTTLAQKLYNQPSIVHRFDKRAFCSISQVYKKRSVLLDILNDLFPNDDEIHRMSDDDLAQRLRKSLKGFRYLIVLDDIWDHSVWNDLRPSFPDDYNGSRVIFTTRINSISLIGEHNSTPYALPFLSDDESWELLQQKIFHKDPCPPHLWKVGKLIAVNCKGLPLAIVLVSGLLARAETSLLRWNEIADNLSSFASSQGCNDIIKLSYKHLPEALKSCFLYLGAFREDEITEAKKLTLLWVAEGFVSMSRSCSLHKIAKKYLNELDDRNLVTVTRRTCNGGIKSYRLHDLIRDFCRAEAQAENYMCFINAHNKNFPMSNVLYQHRINININISTEAEWRSFVYTKPRGPAVHSLLFLSGTISAFFKACFHMNSSQSFLQNFKLVQVLDLQKIIIDGEFPTTVTTLFHLRYLALVFSEDLYVPPDISNLWNLETLILSVLWGDQDLVRFSSNIWKMKRLRHVEVVYKACVALDDVENVFFQLPDLETFSTLQIPPGKDGEEILRRLSNVRKFTCFCSCWLDNQLPKLEILTKLESLSMINDGGSRPLFMFSFPSTIRKLTLGKFFLPWSEFSAIVGMLPRLEVLVLNVNSFTGERWNVEDEEFPNIKSLTLERLNIKEWNASIDSFPSLEKLVVSECYELIKIPPCFSEVPSLKYIKVHYCRKRVVDSAIQIQKDQFDSGNESFEVDIYS